MDNQRLKILLPIVVTAVGLGLAAVIATARPQPQPAAPTPAPPPRVAVQTLTPLTMVLNVRSQGVVAPRRQIELSAQVGGRIAHTAENYATGSTFSAGDTLLQIDPADYETAVERARAGVADARQAVALERGRGLQARREWRDLGSVEANDLFLRKPQLAAAEAQLAAAEAELRQAKLNLERTVIKAPFNGRLRSVSANLGQSVNAGTPLASFYASDVVEITLPLNERQLSLLDLALTSVDQPPNLPVTVYARLGNRTWQREGTITRTAAVIDEQTRFVHAIAEVSNTTDEHTLMVGQFVDVDIPSRTLENVLVIPEAYLHPRSTLWLVDEEGRLQLKGVTVLQARGGNVAVQMDNSQPVQIVTSYLATPIEGMALSIETTEETMGALK